MVSKRTKRKLDRERMRALRERRSAKGMKTVSINLPADVFELLVSLKKNTGATYSQIIGAGIVEEAMKQGLVSDKKPDAKSPGDGAVAKLKASTPSQKWFFRLNPTTGRREYIADYDPAKHKAEVVFWVARDDRVRVNSSRSKYNGKVMEVTSYSEDYDVVRGKIGGRAVDFHADRLDFQLS